MSIIQTIRDKATWFISIIIGLSLVGFLLMDAGKATGRMGNTVNSIGTVNGKDIDRKEYDAGVKNMEARYAEMGSFYGDMIKGQVWDQLVVSQVVSEEAEKMGIVVSVKELEDYIYNNPPEDLKRLGSDEKGVFDANRLRQQLDAMKKSKDQEQINQVNQYFEGLAKSKLQQKYMALLSNTVYYPKWMAEKMNSDNNSMARIAYVNIPYGAPGFLDTAKVSDEEINSYVRKHKNEYKQELTRDISVVAFNAIPSGKDTNALVNNLNSIKQEMANSTEADMGTFLARNGSVQNLANMYVLESKLQVPNADTIKTLAPGSVFGPYMDQNNYVLAKMLSKKNIADSVFCRHILFRTTGEASGDSLAEKRIDSVILAINNGSDFLTVMKAVSDDKGATSLEGGVMKFSSTQMQDEQSFDKDFAQFALFDGRKGERKKVKTKFGYHYIEILDQTGIASACKIAYLSKPLLASQATEDSANGLANQFLVESRNAKTFKENAEKRNYNIIPLMDLKPGDDNIAQFGKSRELVRWAYEADKGKVSEQVFTVGNAYVVALVNEINPEGLQNSSRARLMVEPLVRKERSAIKIKEKIKSATNLEAVATATGQQVLRADSLSFSNPFLPNVGMENKVAGYAFNANAKGKVSPPITGNSGVFVVKTESVYAKPNQQTNIEEFRNNIVMNQRSMGGRQVMEALKKTATIKDKRSEIY
jgi:peptidyl-prolyl cis-trans isomerase D